MIFMKHDEMSDMTCHAAREQFALLLYGELSFDQEERVEAHLDACGECRAALEQEKMLHAGFDSVEVAPSPSLLRECREDLRLRLIEEASQPASGAARSGWWDRFVDAITLRPASGLRRSFPGIPRSSSGMPRTSSGVPRTSSGVPRTTAGALLRPLGALTLIAIGFAAAQFAPRFVPVMDSGSGAFRAMGLGDVGAARVRNVEPSADGRVHIVLDETRQRIVSGGVDDLQIRALLITAAQDPSDPGLRAETVELLTPSAKSADVRAALVLALRRDQNAGVRMKAMEALKPFVNDPEVRGAVTQVLLSDANPGLRTQAIDLLTGSANASVDRNVDRQIVGTLQELMERGEQQGYVRERCRRVLQAVNASLETY
jgi:anti-sigma factor RsiW